jgi:XTP/dITP diphosphohydrolase
MSVNLTTPLVLASHNAGKLREFETLLAPLNLTVVSAGSLNLPEPEETGTTFEANAALKAEAAAQASGFTALADDSGLCVPALDDAPGIYSARWAGPNKDFTAAMDRIATELRAKGVEPEGAAAYFVCVLTLADAAGNITHMRGEIHGTLTFPARGDKGFGYDPIFIPTGYTETFGEMDAVRKHEISHRAKAFAALKTFLTREHAA